MEQYCVPYEQNEIDYFFDATWKAAKAMGIMANICGGLTMIVAFCLSCMSMPKMFLNFTTFLSAAAGFFQCLTFIAFSSDICKNYNCQFHWGAGSAVGALSLYFLNSCLLYTLPQYQGEEDAYDNRPAAAAAAQVNPPPGSVQTRVEVMADGTKTTTRTTINAGKNFSCTYITRSTYLVRLRLFLCRRIQDGRGDYRTPSCSWSCRICQDLLDKYSKSSLFVARVSLLLIR